MPSQADVIATVLAEAGVDRIFGVPGSLSSVELIDAAARKGIPYVLCSNESSAAAAAGVYGALKETVGVVSTGVGPGAAAVVHGVAHLHMERSPVLILTDRYGEQEYRRLPRQRLEQHELFRSVTKATLEVSKYDVAATMRRAIDIATSGRPGPVHVDLPHDVMLAPAEDADFPPPIKRVKYVSDGAEASEGIRAAAAMIESASRPAVIVGYQVPRRGEAAERAFAGFAERLGVPVFATLGAKGTLREDHALAAGTFRGVASEKALLDGADLLVLVGFDPVEVFTPGVWLHKQPIVSIDEVPYDEGPYLPAVEVVTGMTEGLRALTSVVTPHAWNREDIDSYKGKREAALNPTRPGLQPASVIRITRQHLGDTGILTVDAGQHKVVTSDLWETRRAKGFFSSSGLGTMAVSLPAAIGAKLAEPSAPVVCFTGDGGFLMRVGDLETAVREKAPIVVVVFNDRVLNLIKIAQDRRGYEHLGINFGETDFAAVARGFGFQARKVTSDAELDATIQEALASGQPWLIDAIVDGDGY
jgi:acetolactate synthase-1/2/3 large subunit